MQYFETSAGHFIDEDPGILAVPPFTQVALVPSEKVRVSWFPLHEVL